MTKREQKVENLKKLIADIEKKMEKLEAQKVIYQISLENLEQSTVEVNNER